MADNAPDKKEIQDAKAALDNYNDALQDSINLAKQLSNQVSKLPESLKFSEAANNNLIKWANNYEQSLKKTLALSERVKTGKVKEKEVTDQINTLTKKYQEYLFQNEASFKNTGRFLLKQKSLKEEINSLEKEEIERRAKLTTEYQRFETLQQKLAQETEKYNNANNILEKQRASRAMKTARQEIADSNLTLTILEKTQVSHEKIISQKKSEKKEVDNVIKSHKTLVENYKKQIEDNKVLLNYLREQNSLGNAVKTIYNNIKDKVTDTLKPLALITAGFELFKKLAFGVSDQVTKLQKNLVLSRDEAYEVRQNFNDIAIASGDAAINTARLVEANIALSKQLGFASTFTDDLNVQFVKLTKQIGLSEEAAGGLAKLSVATGATLEESKNIALGTVQALSSQYGIQLRQQDVLEEIGKISGQTLAMFKANPKALAEAVAQARLLGTNLETTRKQAASLLDFETSIENELQAELLTGRELNLERARTAALTGDLTTTMKELNNQNIDFNKFSNMNVIAQDKIAAALGLSSDELSDQLFKQQYLGRSVKEVAALEGEEVANRLQALNAQDKFNLAIEKMQDAIGQIVGGPLGKLVDMMATLASSSAFVYGTLAAMAGISLAKLVSSLVSVAATLSTSAIASTATASALTLGLAAAGIIAGIGVVAAAIGAFTADAQAQAQEAGDMFSSKGKTIVSTKEGGLFSLSDNDDLAVAPGIGDMIGKSKTTVVAQDNSELIAAVASLKEVMTGVKDGVNTLNRKEVTVKANTQIFGTAQLMGNTNLA